MLIMSTGKSAGRFASAPSIEPHFHACDERLDRLPELVHSWVSLVREIDVSISFTIHFFPCHHVCKCIDYTSSRMQLLCSSFAGSTARVYSALFSLPPRKTDVKQETLCSDAF